MLIGDSSLLCYFISCFTFAAIRVKCAKNSVVVTWKVKESLVDTPSKLLLGDCYPSKFFPTPDGGGEAFFHYHYSDCFFRKLVYGLLCILNAFNVKNVVIQLDDDSPFRKHLRK